MQFTVKYFERQFNDEVSKQAYLKACKWLAQHVIGKVEVGDSFHRITKVKDTDLPTFKLELFAALESGSLKSKFCERCKSFHKSFYVNQEYNCNACKLVAFNSQVDEKLSIKRGYRAERLNYIIDK